jgi:dCTP diphosphatase
VRDLDELKAAVLAFAKDREWEPFHTPKNLSAAVAIEAAELQELFLWLTPEQSEVLAPDLKAKIEDEVGDVLICLVNFAARAGIDPLAAAARKILKNHEKYPVEKVRGSAKKYDEY